VQGHLKAAQKLTAFISATTGWKADQIS
jgi:hypothetical protein